MVTFLSALKNQAKHLVKSVPGHKLPNSILSHSAEDYILGTETPLCYQGDVPVGFGQTRKQFL